MVEGFEAMEQESVSMFKEGKGDTSGACAVCVVLTGARDCFDACVCVLVCVCVCVCVVMGGGSVGAPGSAV